VSAIVNRCFILKQKEADFRHLKKGDIFQLETRDTEGGVTYTEWNVALTDATEDPDHPGQYTVPSDKMYFIVGKPEVSTVAMRKLEIPSQVFSIPTQEKKH